MPRFSKKTKRVAKALSVAFLPAPVAALWIYRLEKRIERIEERLRIK